MPFVDEGDEIPRIQFNADGSYSCTIEVSEDETEVYIENGALCILWDVREKPLYSLGDRPAMTGRLTYTTDEP